MHLRFTKSLAHWKLSMELVQLVDCHLALVTLQLVMVEEPLDAGRAM